MYIYILCIYIYIIWKRGRIYILYMNIYIYRIYILPFSSVSRVLHDLSTLHASLILYKQWSTSRLSTCVDMFFGLLFLLSDSYISRNLVMNVAHARTDRKSLSFPIFPLLLQVK